MEFCRVESSDLDLVIAGAIGGITSKVGSRGEPVDQPAKPSRGETLFSGGAVADDDDGRRPP